MRSGIPERARGTYGGSLPPPCPWESSRSCHDPCHEVELMMRANHATLRAGDDQ